MLDEIIYSFFRNAKIMQCRDFPVYDCRVSEVLFETGIGHAIFSRKCRNGDVAAAVFLLDVHCLGVKDVYFKIMSRGKFEAMVEKFDDTEGFSSASPEKVRRLVEESIRYALGCGLNPHPAYYDVSLLFGDVDSSAYKAEFTFGNNGKPYYVQGPNDSPRRVREIMENLTQTLGGEGFDFLLVVADQKDFADVMPTTTGANRNDPCPCGSGKKFKKCCLYEVA